MIPFTPITREQAAAILSVSLSTLDAMIAAGSIPEPRALPGGRRKYWHPEIFYTWLDQQLRGDAPDPENSEPDALMKTSLPKSQFSTAPNGIAASARARDTSRLRRLNEGTP